MTVTVQKQFDTSNFIDQNHQNDKLLHGIFSSYLSNEKDRPLINCLVRYHLYSPMSLQIQCIPSDSSSEAISWLYYRENDLLSLMELSNTLPNDKAVALAYLGIHSSALSSTWIVGFTIGKKSTLTFISQKQDVNLIIPNHWMLYDPERNAWSDLNLPEELYQKTKDRDEVVGLLLLDSDKFILAWTLDMHILLLPISDTYQIQEWALHGRTSKISYTEKLTDNMICFGRMDGSFDILYVQNTELFCMYSETSPSSPSPVTGLKYISPFLFIIYEQDPMVVLYQIINSKVSMISVIRPKISHSMHFGIILDGFSRDCSYNLINMDRARELVFSILFQPLSFNSKKHFEQKSSWFYSLFSVKEKPSQSRSSFLYCYHSFIDKSLPKLFYNTTIEYPSLAIRMTSSSIQLLSKDSLHCITDWINSWQDLLVPFQSIHDRYFEEATGIAEMINTRPFFHQLIQEILQELSFNNTLEDTLKDFMHFIEETNILDEDYKLLIYYYLLCSFRQSHLDRFISQEGLSVEYALLIEALWCLDMYTCGNDHSNESLLDRAWKILGPDFNKKEELDLPPISPAIQYSIFDVYIKAQQPERAISFARSRDIYKPTTLIALVNNDPQLIVQYSSQMIQLILKYSNVSSSVALQEVFDYYRQIWMKLEYLNDSTFRKQLLKAIFDCILLSPKLEETSSSAIIGLSNNNMNENILSYCLELRESLISISLDHFDLSFLLEYCILIHPSENTHDFMIFYNIKKGKLFESLKFYPLSLCYPSNMKSISSMDTIYQRYYQRDCYLWTIKERLPTHYLKYLQDYYQKGMTLEDLEKLVRSEIPISPLMKQWNAKRALDKTMLTTTIINKDQRMTRSLFNSPSGIFASPIGERVQVQCKTATSKSMPLLPIDTEHLSNKKKSKSVLIPTSISPIPSSPRRALKFTPRTPSKLKMMTMNSIDSTSIESANHITEYNVPVALSSISNQKKTQKTRSSPKSSSRAPKTNNSTSEKASPRKRRARTQSESVGKKYDLRPTPMRKQT